jgi:ribonuclease HI
MYSLYTDGSCLGNPGTGGWAAMIPDLFAIKGSLPHTTNNIMELTAVVKGLEKCVEYKIESVAIFTDSIYVKKGMTEWMFGWKNRNWKTVGGQDVKNKKLWMTLDELVKKFTTVECHWVKAHAGNLYNECVDSEARRCAMLEQSG